MIKTNPLFAALFGMLAIQPLPPSGALRYGKKPRTRGRTPGAAQPAGSKLARMAREGRIGGRAS
jgi:hypothetical protein